MSESRITIVIPTFNRISTLLLCMQALEVQTMKDFDVIVVIDGATDSTEEMMSAFAATSLLRLRILSQNNAGPARARNLGLAYVVTHIAVLIGDDIIPAPGFLAEHLRFHSEHPGLCELALGWTKWDTTHQDITLFMQWYEDIQFDYGRLLRGVSPSWQHAYTSNLSFKTTLLQQNLFDERFRFAGWEDSELAYRLQKQRCFHLTFLYSAVAMHIHPTTFLQASRRMVTLGRMERLFHQIHPESLASASSGVVQLICFALGKMPHILSLVTWFVSQMPIPGKLHGMVLRAHQQKGYLEIL